MIEIIIEYLKYIDVTLFYFINVNLSNAAFDKLMPLVTNLKYWLPIYSIGAIFLVYRYKIRGLLIIILLLLTAGLCDWTGAILKDFFDRLRPCWELNNINLLVPCGAGKSFPSNHSANNFGAAIVLTYFFRQKWYYYYFAALLVALSRVFIGVHYPFDILGGAALGSIIGVCVIFLYKRLILMERVKKLIDPIK